MKLPIFSIKHPVVTIVISALIVLIGLLCFKNIGLREYPKIEKLALQVRTLYPNTSAEIIENSVTNVLEENLAGIEGLESISSFSKQAESHVNLYFKNGTSLDRAMIATRDAISAAKNDLPEDLPNEPNIQRSLEGTGLPFMGIVLSADQSNFTDLTHYTNLNIKNAFRSVPGVSKVEIWGQQPIMEIKLDAKKMYAFGMNPSDIFNIIDQKNKSWAVGKFQDSIPTTLDLALTSVKDFEDLLLKTIGKTPILLKHVARVTFKGNDKHFRARIGGRQALFIAISRASDSNPLEVSDHILQTITELKQSLPRDVKMEKVVDQAKPVRESIRGIQWTVIEASILVLMVVFLFLQSIRLSLIPLVTIPMSLLGSVILLNMFGFSINILTLLGMVLAIGLVVDDAIVVLENVERHVEEGQTPLEASKKGSSEIGFAIVAMTLTLAAVYLPLAFIKGEIGQLFIEFAVSLAGSVVISGFIALTLSPLMCAKLVKAEQKQMFPSVTLVIHKIITYCQGVVEKVFYKTVYVFMAAGMALGLIIVLAYTLPHEIAPIEDRSLVGIYLQPIAGKDISFMDEQLKKLETLIGTVPEAEKNMTFMGPWGGQIVFALEEPMKRKKSALRIVEELRLKTKDFPSFDADPWSQNSGLPGMEFSGAGGDLELNILTTASYKNLFDTMEGIKKNLEEKGTFKEVRHHLKFDTLGYDMHINKFIQSKAGLSSDQIAKAIEIYFSGNQGLQFIKDGLRYDIVLKGDRMPWSLDEVYLVNPKGNHVSLGALAHMTTKQLPKELEHHNQMRSARLKITLHNKSDMGAQMQKVQDLVKEKLPRDSRFSWGGAAKEYIKTSSDMFLLICMALVFIYAILALQFENFIDPLIIMLTVPLACVGALMTLWIFGGSFNIYTQIGLITLIGLITKHGILIVEFANKLNAEGIPLDRAIIKAVHTRLRPIFMTTGAMILGTVPLIISRDTGFEARQAIGLVLVGGLFVGTTLTLFVFPTLFWKTKDFMRR